MIYFASYDPETRRVTGYGVLPDEGTAAFHFSTFPQHVRLEAPLGDWSGLLYVDGQLVTDRGPKPSPDELAVRGAILSELAATDYTQIPDYDISPERRAAWAAYRQTLRIINNHPITAAVLASFPSDPKGRNLAQANGWIQAQVTR